MSNPTPFDSIEAIATHLREKLNEKNFILLFAHNGTGKTRLSVEFKNRGKKTIEHGLVTESGNALITESGDAITATSIQGDTLYFNAFTEDLFSWDNDLENDTNRFLKINKDSRFFAGLDQLEMESKIRPLLSRYASFYFKIDYQKWTISFQRDVLSKDKEGNPKSIRVENIKISRGEENIFIFCFFLAVVELAIKDNGSGPYDWVKYIFVDDPISSLDDNNAIAVGTHLAQLLLSDENKLKTIISTHHALFFNVMFYGLKKNKKKFSPIFLKTESFSETPYTITKTQDTPFFQHVALLKELQEVSGKGNLYTYHFNILRSILEKTASFLGYNHFSDCLAFGESEDEKEIHKRSLDILSHGKYSIFEPKEMIDDNKVLFRKILDNFIKYYKFNTDFIEIEEDQ